MLLNSNSTCRRTHKLVSGTDKKIELTRHTYMPIRKATYIVIVKDGQPAHVELVAYSRGGRENVEVQPVNCIAQIFAQSQCVELKVDFEQRDNDLQDRLLLPRIVCTRNICLSRFFALGDKYA